MPVLHLDEPAALARRALRPVTAPPGRRFHAVLAGASVWLLWVLGVPGFAFLTVMALVYLLAGAAALWAVKITAFVVRRRGAAAGGSALRFLVAPAGAVVVAALAWGGVPLQARWAVSEAAFARVVAEAGPPVAPAEIRDLEVPWRVGAYRVVAAHRVGDAVIFVEPTGLLFDDAGFAYLPHGPFPALEASFERPRFEHLRGSWYVWTSSW